MPAVPSLAELRRLIAARFPTPERREETVVPTGVAALDEVCGGLGAGVFTELVCGVSGGGGLALAAVLEQTRRARRRLVLLDAADGFAPDEFAPELLEHVVWARGGGEGETLKSFWAAADLLLRDGHFAVAVLDLRGIAERELLRTPGGTWYRLQHALEQSAVAALVLSPAAVVPCARGRWRLETTLGVETLGAGRAELAAGLRPRMERQRGARLESA